MSKFKVHEVVFYKEDDDGNPIEDANGNVVLYHDAFGNLDFSWVADVIDEHNEENLLAKEVIK